MSEQYIIDYTDISDDIISCLKMLYSTRAGSMPMCRDFGIDYDGIAGSPLDVAKNRLALEIIDKTERYEPRATVESVEFKVDADIGRLVPIIHIAKAGVTNE